MIRDLYVIRPTTKMNTNTDSSRSRETFWGTRANTWENGPVERKQNLTPVAQRSSISGPTKLVSHYTDKYVSSSGSDAPYTVQVQMDAGLTETQQLVFILCLTIQPNTNSLFDPLFGNDYQIECKENI